MYLFLQNLEEKLTSQNATLENADQLGLKIMQRSEKQEIARIQKMIDEYQLLWKAIQERIIRLKSELKRQIAENKLPKEVDESIQVETLRFEQDTAVQVNTLPPRLHRMTSICAKDAYIVELESAIKECIHNISSLNAYVQDDIPEQGSPKLNSIAKKISTLTAATQSSIELMNHLYSLLVNECDASDEEARTEQVEQLTLEFNSLIDRAKQKELKIRDLR